MYISFEIAFFGSCVAGRKKNGANAPQNAPFFAVGLQYANRAQKPCNNPLRPVSPPIKEVLNTD